MRTRWSAKRVTKRCRSVWPTADPTSEAVEYLPGEDRELAENHLALCPNCAAKWRHANGDTRETLLAALRDAVEPHVTLTLAGQQIRLRFVDVHLQDLKSALGFGGEDKMAAASA